MSFAERTQTHQPIHRLEGYDADGFLCHLLLQCAPARLQAYLAATEDGPADPTAFGAVIARGFGALPDEA